MEAHKNIVFEEKTRSEKILKAHGIPNEKKQEPVELSVVKSRMDKLFGQDRLYEKVKEKLVCVMIYSYPALQEVFTKLINNKSINDNLQKLLLEKISFLKNRILRLFQGW